MIPPPISPESTQPWYFMGTWEGFMMVRLSSEYSVYPECYSVNGVNCILGQEVDDLLPVLESYQKNKTISNNSSTFSAPCGPKRYEHWGFNADWCATAATRLQSPPTNREKKFRMCVLVQGDIIAQYLTTSKSLCIPASTANGKYNCRHFPSIATCYDSLDRYLYSEDYVLQAFTMCGVYDNCPMFAVPSYAIPTTISINYTDHSKRNQVLYILLASFLMTTFGLLFSWHYKGRFYPENPNLYRLSETCHSADDCGEVTNDSNNNFVRVA
ncbi:hypothetical protein THRCLA_22853 [Thraustotheca clavata]|uniref:Uncharacterized protein n=1 Tax=Thraustotheca clavata TaxID=74557 RepID=A0A1V9YSB3_9STRA|nr:hypothetical protein THRCLA_22853 [Thraustotheca clavata]